MKAIASVSIRPRVAGELTGVFFKEGDHVKKDQKLFTIDRREYEAAVKLAVANKAKSEAALAGAKTLLERRKSEKGAGSPLDYDAAVTAVDSAQAAVAADEEAIKAAQVQLDHTVITAPIDGRVGELLVPRGNVVDAYGLNPLVVINQIKPITVAFTLPEQQLPVVLAALKPGLKLILIALKPGHTFDPLRVEASVRGGGPVAVGELGFVDNTADPLTGTIQFKASFVNDDEALWPGLFVDVVLTLGHRTNSVVVPAAAVQTGQKGQYVYVVTPEKTVELRPVTVAFYADGEAVIASGLNGGETVVVEGQLRLAPGTKVDSKPYRGRGAPPAVPTPVVTGGGK